MILKFPNLATLQMALTSGAIPPTVAASAAVAGFGDGEDVWVETSASLARATQNELKRLGVQVHRSSGAAAATEVATWLELLPLQPNPDPLQGLEQTPVLFDLTDGEHMARLATEMLRLGNDRQGFRWLDADKGGGRALLRVVGPPYYSLLRALDYRDRPGAPVAYIEQAPGVWVEVGYAHPLADRVKPAKGKILLLRPPRQWSVLDDGPFRDVYEVLEFALPDAASHYHEGRLQTRLAVPLSLKPGGSPDNPELWVLRDDAVAELNRFVQNNDNELLRRLAFAIGEKDGKRTVVVRVRQSRLPPPQLVLNAQGYRHHLKLPNLFLPVGMGLHPPLRRDKVRELFAEDVALVTWLAPGPDGTFTVQSLPEDAFRSLEDWVDYVLDHDREALQAWVQASQFEFEPFTCNEDGTPKPKKAEHPERSRSQRPRPAGRGHKGAGEGTTLFQQPETPQEETPEPEEFAAVEKIEPSEIEKELHALEQQFLEMEGPLDRPERLALWPELAARYAALRGHGEDAALCWLNALWEQKAASPAWAWAWLRTEALAGVPRYETGHKPVRSWLSSLSSDGRPHELPGEDLDRLLKTKQEELTTNHMMALAAYLVWATRRTPPPALVERLQPMQRFLEAHERLLPVRGVWLAWSHLAQLSGGDVLALARARDRLLERLFHNGLRPEQDLPGFLRFAGAPTSQRFGAVRMWIKDLVNSAQKWVKDNKDQLSNAPTEAYVDLIFAFGLARLGEVDAARERLNRAAAALAGKDDAHTFLLGAYRYRILQAIDGKPPAGPLPDELLGSLKGMSSLHPYIIDRLRKISRILEPEQRIEPYRKQLARSEEDKLLVEMVNLTNRQEIVKQIQNLLKAVPKGDEFVERRAKVLRAALEAAPRVGEDFAKEILKLTLEALATLDRRRDPGLFKDQAELVEKALFVAAHFDRAGDVHALVARFEHLLQAERETHYFEIMETVVYQCFRGLRKLGMRDQIDRLLGSIVELLLEGSSLEAADVMRLRPLLAVAGEYYFFNRDALAEPFVQKARAMLIKGEQLPKDQYPLACAYARTVAQAPVVVAQQRLEELFKKVQVKDGFTTSQYFSLSQLAVTEAVVLATVSDDFTLGSQARRWLDEDEFLVRRRIHHDVRTLMAQG
jgi:hypothetical protein